MRNDFDDFWSSRAFRHDVHGDHGSLSAAISVRHARPDVRPTPSNVCLSNDGPSLRAPPGVSEATRFLDNYLATNNDRSMAGLNLGSAAPIAAAAAASLLGPRLIGLAGKDVLDEVLSDYLDDFFSWIGLMLSDDSPAGSAPENDASLNDHGHNGGGSDFDWGGNWGYHDHGGRHDRGNVA